MQLNVIIILEILESCTSEPHLYLAPSQRVTLLEFRVDTHKTRMIGLPCGEKIVTIHSAVSIQHWNVSDRRTDRIRMSISRLSTAALTRDKKMTKLLGLMALFVKLNSQPSLVVCLILLFSIIIGTQYCS